MSSKRAQQLVGLAARVTSEAYRHQNEVLSPNSNASSPVTFDSPLPPWWKDIFEASDISRKLLGSVAARRKLFSSPVKGATAGVLPVNGVKLDGSTLPQNFIIDSKVGGDEIFIHKASKSDNTKVGGDEIFIHKASKSDNTAHSRTLVEAPCEQFNRNDRQGECETTFPLDNVTNGATEIPHMEQNVSVACPSEFSTSVKEKFVDSFSIPVSLSENHWDQHLKTSPAVHGQGHRNIYPSRKKIAEAKLALNSGKEHVTHSGKVRRARNMRLPCAETCKRCQIPRMTNAERLEAHEKFWGMENHLDQWKFINESIKVSVPKKKFAAHGSRGEKLSSRSYFFIVDGQAKKICKTMFLNTLSICDSWINSALSHCSGSFVREDQRGRHSNRPKRGPKMVQHNE